MNLELIEIYNEMGLEIGVMPRNRVHSQGDWHKGVHAFLFDRDNRLLIQKRSVFCDTFPGALDCSLSEHLSVGEAFETALSRGCREELGLNQLNFKRLLAYKMQYGPTDNMICEIYSASIDPINIIINETEIGSIQFVHLESLQELMIQNSTIFTSWFYQQLLWYFGKPNKLQILEG